MLTNSFVFLANNKLQTWEPVSIDYNSIPSNVFQNLIVRSAVPPPLVSKPCWWGDQANALTAALWDENLNYVV